VNVNKGTLAGVPVVLFRSKPPKDKIRRLEQDGVFDMAEKNYIGLVEKLNIDKSLIVDDLTLYYDMVYNRHIQKSKIERTWGSIEDYVDSLYWMKFVMKLSNYEMDELTGVKDFYKALKHFGWHYFTFDFKQCVSIHDAECDRLESIFMKYNDDPSVFESEAYKQKRNRISLKPVSLTRILNNYGVDDIEELLKQLYYLVYVAQLNTSEIAIIYKKDRLTINKLLSRFDMSISKKEARRRIEEHGRGNHMQSAVNTKKVILNHSIKKGMVGSNAENILRSMIETRLYSYLDVTKYEFIVGLSSNAIIPPREVDIPVLIYKKDAGEYYKYAIELDGNAWHKNDNENGENKEPLIKNTEWKLIRIWFKSAGKAKDKIEMGFRKMADDVCIVIRNNLEGEKNKWDAITIDGF